MSNPEQLTGSERGAETPKVTLEHYEHAKNSYEKKEVLSESAEKRAERARFEALEKAVSVEKAGAEKDKKPRHSSPARRRGAISKHEKKASFNKHMKQVQSEMSLPARTFSKFIHLPAVEKASEVLGSTVARPNSILAGSVAAFILVLAVYLVAKHFGYPLSGFETMGAFIVGWVLGSLYDYVKLLATGKKD